MGRIVELRRPSGGEMLGAVARAAGTGVAMIAMLVTGVVIGQGTVPRGDTAAALPAVRAPEAESLPVAPDPAAGTPVAEALEILGEAGVPQPAVPVETEAQRIVREARERFAPSDPEAWATERWGYVPQATAAAAPVEEIEHGDARGNMSVSPQGKIAVNGETILLSGLEMPGPGAICHDSAGAGYDCHGWAVQGMRSWIEGQEAICATSRIGGTLYGTCEMAIAGKAGAMIDVGSWLVSSGLAIAQDIPAASIYRQTEEIARGEGRGLWSGSFSFGGRAWKP